MISEHPQINNSNAFRKRRNPCGLAATLLPVDPRALVIPDGTIAAEAMGSSDYDKMQQANDSGNPYQTRLDPPPGPPTDSDGNFIPMDQWNEADWPEHVHQPRQEATLKE